MDFMKNKTPVLEYCVAKMSGKKAKWMFKFTTPEGETLMESAMAFDFKTQAEAGFIGLIKSVATNQYKVEYPEHSRN